METDVPDWLFGDVVDAAQMLIGCHVVRGDRIARIVEVEAYRGSDDPGCHAFTGKTKRTAIMFGPPGFAYVYFTYGTHWMLNVVAQADGDAAAILIRAAIPISGIDLMRELRPKATCEQDLLSGPGKIAAAFNITGKDYGVRLFCHESELRIIPANVRTKTILKGPRIGLAQGKGDTLLWRFVDADALAWVSKPTKSLIPI